MERTSGKLLALVMSTCLGCLCGTASGAARSGFGLTVLVDEGARPEYSQGAAVYVEALRGKSYALRLTNPTPYRVGVALSVDGLNTIDARHTAAREGAKWILGPYESTVISGWQVNDRAARNFFFTGETGSYGAALGQTENLGVIEAVYFRERQPDISRYQPSPLQAAPESEGTKRKDAAAPPSAAGAQSTAAKESAAPSDDYAATGMGRRERHEVERVNIDLESQPLASVRIRYEFRPQLVKLGILPPALSPLDRREAASGFGVYCPEMR
jgi:hypothetical protein